MNGPFKQVTAYTDKTPVIASNRSTMNDNKAEQLLKEFCESEGISIRLFKEWHQTLTFEVFSELIGRFLSYAIEQGKVQTKVYHVDFGGNVLARIKVLSNNIKVIAAMNGYGEPIDISTINVIPSDTYTELSEQPKTDKLTLQDFEQDSIARKLISEININQANVNHIAASGIINGSLLVDLISAFTKYQQYVLEALQLKQPEQQTNTLPTDEEIDDEGKSIAETIGGSNSASFYLSGFTEGAKWMRDRMKGGNGNT